MKRYLPFIIIGAGLLAAISVGLWLGSSQSAPDGSEPHKATFASQPPAPKASPAPGAQPPHIRGNPEATVTIEEFGDFQCPPCALLDPEMRKIEVEYGARIRVIFRNYPLTKAHPHALDAARAAEAAALQGKYWEMHDMIYDKQNEWSVMPDARPTLLGFARRLGLDVERFTRDMDSRVVETRIINDLTRGESMGVKGTPTVFVNGRELPYEYTTPTGLRGAIDNAMRTGG
jgi:protein-disulfide isomerase